MFPMHVDLKMFYSVHQETLQDILSLRGIPASIIGLLTGLYSGTMSAVKYRAVSSFFLVNAGGR